MPVGAELSKSNFALRANFVYPEPLTIAAIPVAFKSIDFKPVLLMVNSVSENFELPTALKSDVVSEDVLACVPSTRINLLVVVTAFSTLK